MAADITERVREIAEARGVSEDELLERAEREVEAVEEDVRWGLNA